MELKVERKWFSDRATVGALAIDGTYECFTLEDAVREDGRIVQAWKLPGCTAIPMGRYTVIVTPSVRFKRDLPLLCNVPGFEGVRIHPGNGPEDTEGCLLVGCSKGPDVVFESRKAFDQLFPKIQAAVSRGEPVTIDIS